MSQSDVFERYFRFRCQQAGAVTPGQQLQVLAQLRREAEQEGRVPLSDSSVVQVDLNNPAVQAVLRGEPVSIGARTVQSSSGGALKLPKSRESLSTGQKIGIMAALLLLPTVISLIFFMRGSRKKAQALATPTAAPTATLSAAAPDGLPEAQTTSGELAAAHAPQVSGGSDRQMTADPVGTAAGTGAPAAAADTADAQVVYLPMDNPAAPEAVAPASLEIGGQHFIIQVGEVDTDSGVWEPKGGVEWLPTTFVRRVIAVPKELLENVSVQEGDLIRMRMRDGFVANYQVTRVIPDLLTDRIEVFNGSTPSVAVVAYSNNLRDPRRLVIIGEMMLPVGYQGVRYDPPTPTPAPAATPTPDGAHTKRGLISVDDVNLRSGPSTHSPVKAVLARLTEVTIHTDVPHTEADGYTWLFVDTPAGDGWVADYFVIPQE